MIIWKAHAPLPKSVILSGKGVDFQPVRNMLRL
jgi:hypothetical protein